MEEVGKYAQPEAQMLIEDLRQIVKQARSHVAATANYELTMMYWHIGERINRDLLGNQRAEYGKRGFETRNIRRMMQQIQKSLEVAKARIENTIDSEE